MALTPSFTITPLGNGSSFTVADTSTGSDGAITDRVITLYKVDNSVFGIFDFPLSAGSSITINALTQDIALNAIMTWNNNVGTPLYSFSLIFAFVQYALLFLSNLTQFQISNPSIVNDTFYMGNKFNMFTEVQSALNAINTGQSLGAAQSAILRYQNLIVNANDYF